MSLIAKDRIWIGVGLIRNQRGIFLYEAEGDSYRILADVRGDEESERIVDLINRKKHVFERDLHEEHFSNCCEGREDHAEVE